MRQAPLIGGSSRRASPATARFRRRSSLRRRSSSPGWPPRPPSGCSSSTSEPRGSSTSARSARPGSRCGWATTASTSKPLFVVAMCAAAGILGALWALIPGVLRAFANTNEIITSLMLNYVAGYLLTYLIFDSSSYWRDVSTLQARAFPQGKPMPSAAEWATFGSRVVVPLGFLIGLLAAATLWVLYSRTRFGFEVSVIADSPRAARYAGMRTRRKILAVMALSGRGRGHRRGEPGRATSRTRSTAARRACRRRRSGTRGSSSRRSRATTRSRSASSRCSSAGS